MNLEIICSSCQGRLIAQQSGIVVACPHCRAHLFVPASGTPALPSDYALPFDPNASASHLSDNPGELHSTDRDELVTSPDVYQTPDFTSQSAGDSDVSMAAQVADAGDTVITRRPANATPNKQSLWKRVFHHSGDVVPKRWFVLAVSYASAVTLVLIILLFAILRIKAHQLESLPDVSQQAAGNSDFVLVPENANLPDGHVLTIGETRQFGVLKVSPIRVTCEPVEVVLQRERQAAIVQQSEQPSLKLWLRLENVSTSQTFVPLGSELLAKRVVDRENAGSFRANQFVSRISDSRRDGRRVLLFDQPPQADWNLKNQNLNQQLAPGQVIETYLATAPEKIDQLTGALVWRLQVRKGINRESQTGVTTLIEVQFDSNQIAEADTLTTL